ncbi:MULTISPECIES: hypothetical protein [Roseobacteraceae]|uniref:hypothetical protein n=1 Tax=Roseobacteraceae TaxID=2854170 RepID=UPI00125F9C2A|nr:MULTISPECIES: hypothetical protein [Roseobacteraceae]KAB6718049.1 hypothetical protein C8029_00625 [Roseobacter sp. TSBP12]|tara:strand:+ start:10764 stop:11168 length:405 start_codon:yes stop_codon:yes gene_type:complete
MVPLAFVHIPRAVQNGRRTRPTRAAIFAILKRGPVLIAVCVGAVSPGIMVLLMTPTPLAMIGCDYGEALAGDVVRWHVVAMFAPSFATGFVIKRFGTRSVMVAGLALPIASALTAASGISQNHFYGALSLLGVG